MSSGISVDTVSTVESGVAYVSPSSSEREGVKVDIVKAEMTDIEKERVEREKEAQKVLGRACSIFTPDCEACSS